MGMVDVPNGIKDDGTIDSIVCPDCLDVVGQGIVVDSAHVDDQRAAQLAQVSGFVAAIGHDGRGADGQSNIGGKILHNLLSVNPVCR